MAEWVVLLVLVPAIVVPVVLIFGFAGCFSKPEFRKPVPMIERAYGLSTSAIRVEWTLDIDPSYYTFVVEVRRGGAFVDSWAAPASPFDVTGLEEETTYEFRMVSVEPDGDRSAWSSTVSASTLGQAFEVPYVAGLDSDVSVEGSCLITRIDRPLRRTGTRLGVTLLGPMSGTTSIDRIWISQPAVASAANPTPDPYDAAADLTEIFDTFTAGAPLVLVAGEVRALPPVDYVVGSTTEPLLVAIDITPAPTAPSNIRSMPITDGTVVTYARSVTEARMPDRTSGYSLQVRIYGLARIDVA